ncbi:hypothetical protein SCWH03_28060 [Streptomyces pacificus]|uniref:Uncharacterized protein n=1 Tax=Streptomyces pacificus TaxID=2705029 RepID=A0A6A0AVW9_9ACTN|nr:hypothetical protein SCWH03_28060 [Streptomyces pacificus]
MCIRTAEVDEQADTAIWDPDGVTITVLRGTHPHSLIREVAALLQDLGAPSPSPGAGLICHCGEPVRLPGEEPAAADATTL